MVMSSPSPHSIGSSQQEQTQQSWYAKSADNDYESSLRPRVLEQFQGQAQLKKNLSVYIHAARARGDTLDHIFISGSHGLGKTSLAYIVANELGVSIKVTSAPVIEKPKDLIGILSTITEHSVLFIDEIHRLKPVVEEILYSAMEDFMVDWVVGVGVDARTVRIPITPFTLICATTQPGKVSAPLHSRFGIRERLDLYSDEALTNIVLRSATILGLTIERDAAERISTMSRGTPRYANSLVRRMRDFAQVRGDGTITGQIVRIGSEELGIDTNGLESVDRNILYVLGHYYRGTPVGLKTLAIAVNESPESLEDFWEVYLIKQGLIKRTPQGRQITERGMHILGFENTEDAQKTQGQQHLV